jgi:hypothetical protein
LRKLIASFLFFCVTLCFLCNKAELQRQQQNFVAQNLVASAAQRHVTVTQQPPPQKATIVYRSQPVSSNEQLIPKSSGQRNRPSRHDGRYTSGKKMFLHELYHNFGMKVLTVLAHFCQV